MHKKTAASLLAGLLFVFGSVFAGSADAAQGPVRIVFERNWNDHEPSQIVSMLPSGADQTVLLTAKDGGLHAPTFSPDGRQIAYTRYLRGGSLEVFVMKANGHHPKQLTRSVQRAELDGSPAFSPSGRRIVYDSTRGTGTTQAHIFSVAAGGGRSKQLTFGPGDDESPSYSPDGSQIVFTRQQGDSEKICVMSARGGQVRCLAQVPNSTIDTSGDPTFSPDGALIVFGRPETGSIDAVNADGSGLRELAKGYSPDFSSSGEIVFVGGEDSSYGIYTMHSDGTSQTIVASGEGKYEFNRPSW